MITRLEATISSRFQTLEEGGQHQADLTACLLRPGPFQPIRRAVFARPGIHTEGRYHRRMLSARAVITVPRVLPSRVLETKRLTALSCTQPVGITEC